MLLPISYSSHLHRLLRRWPLHHLQPRHRCGPHVAARLHIYRLQLVFGMDTPPKYTLSDEEIINADGVSRLRSTLETERALPNQARPPENYPNVARRVRR
jgi:hypothetical protein